VECHLNRTSGFFITVKMLAPGPTPMASVGEKTARICVYGRPLHMAALSADNSLLMAVHMLSAHCNVRLLLTDRILFVRVKRL